MRQMQASYIYNSSTLASAFATSSVDPLSTVPTVTWHCQGHMYPPPTLSDTSSVILNASASTTKLLDSLTLIHFPLVVHHHSTCFLRKTKLVTAAAAAVQLKSLSRDAKLVAAAAYIQISRDLTSLLEGLLESL